MLIWTFASKILSLFFIKNIINNSPDAIGTTNASNSKPPKDGLAKLDDDASKQPKKKGKAGRPRIHHDNQGSVSGSRTNPDGINVSVNEVIPKVWVICNFGVPVMAQIAIEALKKGDKVVLGCCPGGEDESKLLKRADRLWQRYPDRCIVVELDIKWVSQFQRTQTPILLLLTEFKELRTLPEHDFKDNQSVRTDRYHCEVSYYLH